MTSSIFFIISNPLSAISAPSCENQVIARFILLIFNRQLDKYPQPPHFAFALKAALSIERSGGVGMPVLPFHYGNNDGSGSKLKRTDEGKLAFNPANHPTSPHTDTYSKRRCGNTLLRGG